MSREVKSVFPHLISMVTIISHHFSKGKQILAFTKYQRNTTHFDGVIKYVEIQKHSYSLKFQTTCEKNSKPSTDEMDEFEVHSTKKFVMEHVTGKMIPLGRDFTRNGINFIFRFKTLNAMKVFCQWTCMHLKCGKNVMCQYSYWVPTAEVPIFFRKERRVNGWNLKNLYRKFDIEIRDSFVFLRFKLLNICMETHSFNNSDVNWTNNWFYWH